MFGSKKGKSSGIHSLIGSDARIEGNLRFDGGCHLDGVVHGEVSSNRDASAYLSVSEGGRVEGNVRVPRLELSGTVEGDVFISEHANFGATAKVIGNVHYNVIEISAGAEINGKLIHQVAPAPTAAKSAAVAGESRQAAPKMPREKKAKEEVVQAIHPDAPVPTKAQAIVDKR
jgi:cytoskeletal protein CcmA (bactofilin family)